MQTLDTTTAPPAAIATRATFGQLLDDHEVHTATLTHHAGMFATLIGYETSI